MKISLLVRMTVLCLLLLAWGNTTVFASDLSHLIDRNCYSCHAKVIKKFKAVNSAHATEIECKDCHLHHPQRNEAYQIDCASCHDPQQNEHYKIASCGDCHHGHWPLQIDFSKIERPLKPVCSSCHDSSFAPGPSVHTDNLSCLQCHPSHADIPKCLDCHEGHSKGKAKEPCLSCHAAHNPTPAIQAEGPAIQDCSVCHSSTSTVMAADDGAHAQIACNICHARHGYKPECLHCHAGHSEDMLAADCQSCHDPHRPLPPAFTGEIRTTFCAGCHDEVADTFASSGGSHQQNLTCSECHQTHPPAEVKNNPCSNCHEVADSAHFALSECSACHNPHSPQVNGFSALQDVRAACVSCHATVAAEMEKGATAHSEALDCNECHQTHGDSPDCLNCHQGHDEQMRSGDCAKCHSPHSPLPVTFSDGAVAGQCRSCHEQAVSDINNSGRAHKSEIGCIDCHQEHPPAENDIPECANCHDSDDNPHFAVENCAGCHNPHKPAVNEISALHDSRPVCVSCHQQVEDQLVANPSAHDRACVACHREHRGSPSCLGCHNGHGDAMTRADCSACHQPHAPLQITFTNQPASGLCADCHAELTAAVEAAGGAHRDQISCSSCHQEHPAGSCASCHSEHPQKGQGLPESCYSCHALSSHPHFTVGDCQGCHSPHQPLELNLQTNQPLEPVCVSCHQQVAEQFAAMPSGHSAQDCAECHTQHKTNRKCLDCHEAHEQTMLQEDCLRCHSPHQPQDIQLRQSEDLPSVFCAACHEEQAAVFADKGAAHQREFASCASCHPEHGPNGVVTAVECNDCHSRARRRHFTLDDCAGCHDPHQPLTLDLSKLAEVRPVCISCHNNQERLYKQNPNKHTAFDCRKCHAGEHGSSLECQDCHQPHIPNLKQLDCLKCHSPHLPQMIKDRPSQAGDVCAACHREPVAKMQELGSAHIKQPCITCHQSHPPSDEKVIAACSVCHDGDDNQHFTVENCQQCHLGHQPLGHDLAKAENSRAACQACHEDVIEVFTAIPSAHAEQDCTACHQRHAEAQQCSDCHEAHSPGMSYADCLNCHNTPHAPNQVAFAGKMPKAFCQSCHETQVDALAASKALHSTLSCLDCHEGDHGSTLDCAGCHEPPHDEGLHRKFPDCLKCHIDPHDLADWRGGPQVALVVPGNVTIETEDKIAAPAASSEDMK